MYLQQVKNISELRLMSRADLARLAGVSRAAVTQWFHKAEKTGWVNVETQTLLKLAEGLGVQPSDLLEKKPWLDHFRTLFLWDHLYPSMESFVAALIKKQRLALARLVQVLGFYEASKVIGKKVLTDFPKYKALIKPVRRRELELLWPLYQ